MKPDLPAPDHRRHPIRRVSFHTLGCKLNQAETAAMAALFARRGYEVVPFRQEADLTYINTCTVTNEADAKSRQTIRQAVQASPGGRLVAVGFREVVLTGVNIGIWVDGDHRFHHLLAQVSDVAGLRRVPGSGQYLEQPFQPVRLTGWENSVLRGTVAAA